MFKKVFSGAGDFRAWNECKNWLDKHGYSYGSTSCRAPVWEFLKGITALQKCTT